MSAKKQLYTPGESKMEHESKIFNRRAMIGSAILHLFFFLLTFPKLEFLEDKKPETKLEPIKMEFITPAQKNALLQKKIETTQSEVPPTPVIEKKIANGSEQLQKNSKGLGDNTQKNNQVVQKGDPRSKNKTAYKDGTKLRKLRKTDVGSGSARGKSQSTNGYTGGSGDTYNGSDLTNLTDSIMKRGKGLKRLKKDPKAQDDGGAGGGIGGGMGDGAGGGIGDGHFTGSPNGTSNSSKILTNVGSLTGAAKGKIDSSRGFSGLAEKGTISVAGVPVEKIAVSTIDPDAIRRLLRDHIPQFRYCYQSELDTNKNPDGLQGRMNFKFIIGSNGKVQRSEITSDEITSDKVRDCIKNVLHGIQFPAPSGGKTVEVYQPMNFYPKRI